jgi:hypothetical protein
MMTGNIEFYFVRATRSCNTTFTLEIHTVTRSASSLAFSVSRRPYDTFSMAFSTGINGRQYRNTPKRPGGAL